MSAIWHSREPRHSNPCHDQPLYKGGSDTALTRCTCREGVYTDSWHCVPSVCKAAHSMNALQAMEGTDPKGIRMAYVPRPIIKSTHAQAIRRSGLRLARYRGPCKNTFQHVLTAAAINMAVMDSDFFQIRGRDLYCANTVGEIPLSCQFSPFAAYHFRGSRREHTLMEPQNRDPYKSTQDPGARNLHQKIASERK